MAITPPDTVRKLVQDKRFLAADRVGVSQQELATWDPHLLRDPRLLVPVDVQALFVAPNSKETFVRLPLRSGQPEPQGDNAQDLMPEPFTKGQARDPGVYLHWAQPDALLRGRLDTSGQNPKNHLSLPPLPDRWLVLRVACLSGETQPRLAGWVLEADRSVAVPLSQWTEGGSASTHAEPVGPTIERAELNGTAGGHLQWTALLDATLNRMAFHDTLADFSAADLARVDKGCVSYMVAGWYSDPALDVLHSAHSDKSLHQLLDELRWHLTVDDAKQVRANAESSQRMAQRKSLGLKSNSASPSGGGTSTKAESGDVHQVDSMQALSPIAAQSVFVSDASKAFIAQAWSPYASLMHGCIHGVPVTAAMASRAPDLRPARTDLSVAMGQHEDDVLAAFAANGASASQLRATERLLAAFTAQKVAQLNSPDGLVALDEGEHSGAFASRPAGNEGTDRYLQRTQTGGAGGLNIGRNARNEAAAKFRDAQVQRPGAKAAETGMVMGFRAKPTYDNAAATHIKPELQSAAEAMVNTNARSRVGDVLTATQERVVPRPAPRWTFALDPLVALRGAKRSLRHGGDGRANAQGVLSCRWPSQVPQRIEGVVDAAHFVPSLHNGSVPDEALALARECLVLDPYHLDWMTQALTPPSAQLQPIRSRLQAEALIRYGLKGQYDGASPAFSTLDETQARSVDQRLQQEQMGQALRRYSLLEGTEPSLVAVTAWKQPWVPLWLEWEVQLDGVDPASLAAWRLGQIDVNPLSGTPDGSTVKISGRSTLTTGGATTLHRAISDWLKAEDALDAVQAGLVDEATEKAYADLAAAVNHLDVLTANLDGLRQRLLGLRWVDGLQHTPQGQAMPQDTPAGLWAGRLTLTRLRVVDAFGRLLELPAAALKATRVPSRLADPAQPAALLQPPRLLRPARWYFKWVDAATPLGAEGTPARIDQVQPELTVNPVAGFLLPDHLDESLECYDALGQPLGELLHEAASGAVLWEIAPLRQGPADAGPQFGLAPAQAALGNFAAALVAADAQARQGQATAGAGQGLETNHSESALSALLRAIDTTLWTVDTFAGLGSEHVAGLVGHPIAVVRAQLRLELMPPDDIDLSDPDHAAQWDQMQQKLMAQAFEVRIGELTRSDDGVLGFFVNDDYSRLRLVDKVIAATALDTGRNRGHFGLLGSGSANPPASAITHPYIAGTDDADTLSLHVGQTVTLTILMHPGGQCNLTSGLLPRKRLALARDWVSPGLAAIAPSLRTGPVLVEPDLDPQKQVRLPKVSVFGKNQNFLWRDTPATWRSDAILAATQTALLPDLPGELREGWIRVMPEVPDANTPASPTPANGGTP